MNTEQLNFAIKYHAKRCNPNDPANSGFWWEHCKALTFVMNVLQNHDLMEYKDYVAYCQNIGSNYYRGE